jgi:hypothetical protein
MGFLHCQAVRTCVGVEVGRESEEGFPLLTKAEEEEESASFRVSNFSINRTFVCRSGSVV